MLEETTKECLDSEYKSEQNARNYAWFRQYLLGSNIWSLPCAAGGNCGNDSKDNGSNVKVVYDVIEPTIDAILTKQQVFLYNSVINEMKENKLAWEKLSGLKEFRKINNVISDLRQDCIPNGILTEFSENELFKIAPLIDNKHFDAFEEYNTKNYLSKCLIISQSVKSKFQNDMKNLFEEIDKTAIFQAAAVKLEERCIVKASVEYNLKEFPSVASILDLIRCSITFENVNSMFKAIECFQHKVLLKKAGCVKDILRLKNGFNKVRLWKESKDYQYFDIKLNILIETNNNGNNIIGEIQFLTKWLLKFKQMAQKCYSIKRRNDFNI